MINLTLSEAFEFVRKSLDELDMTNNIAADVLKEDKDLYALIESTIEEVALDIHQSAPAYLVEGEHIEISDGEVGDNAEMHVFEDNHAEIKMQAKTARVVSIKACDSYVVTEFFAEDSVEAHKQRNKFVRGTADRPRVIIGKYSEEDYKPTIYYYSFSPNIEQSSMVIEYVPYPDISIGQISISYHLKYPLLYWLVAAVLEIVNEPDKAALWKSKFKVAK